MLLFFQLLKIFYAYTTRKRPRENAAKNTTEQRASPTLWTFSGFSTFLRNTFSLPWDIFHIFPLFRIGHFWFVKSSSKFLLWTNSTWLANEQIYSSPIHQYRSNHESGQGTNQTTWKEYIFGNRYIFVSKSISINNFSGIKDDVIHNILIGVSWEVDFYHFMCSVVALSILITFLFFLLLLLFLLFTWEIILVQHLVD